MKMLLGDIFVIVGRKYLWEFFCHTKIRSDVLSVEVFMTKEEVMPNVYGAVVNSSRKTNILNVVAGHIFPLWNVLIAILQTPKRFPVYLK